MIEKWLTLMILLKRNYWIQVNIGSFEITVFCQQLSLCQFRIFLSNRKFVGSGFFRMAVDNRKI